MTRNDTYAQLEVVSVVAEPEMSKSSVEPDPPNKPNDTEVQDSAANSTADSQRKPSPT